MGLCELENAQCPKTSVHIELNAINCHFEGLLKVFFNAKPINFVRRAPSIPFINPTKNPYEVV